MSLITEDGTGLANAESYASVAEAAAYHSTHGNTDAWEAVEDPEAALRKATDAMLSQYRNLWAGVRKTTTQTLDWPRYNVPIMDVMIQQYYPSNSVPALVKNACAELALKTVDGALITDTERAVQSETIGPLTTTYFNSGDQQKKFSAVDKMLRPFFSYGGYNVRVVRA